MTKQKDLSGFYRHLLRQTTGEEKVPDIAKVKEETGREDASAPVGEVDFSADRDATDSESDSSSSDR